MSYHAHAFFWSSGTMQDLDTAGRYASTTPYSINDNDEIVGAAYLQSNTSKHAVRFDKGQAIDLETEVINLAGWKLQDATGINGAGVIAGRGRLGKHLHGFMLVPVADR